MSPEAPAGVVLVVNPNSNEAVTEGLARSLADLDGRDAGRPGVECRTLREGPFGIESQRDADGVVVPLARFVEARVAAGARGAEPPVRAVISACYSDPGVDTLRSILAVPVLGIQEAGVLTALALGDRFGVLAISEPSIARHRRQLRRMGVLERLAGERALGIGVDESARGEATFDRLVEVGTLLVERDGGDVLVLGCAGMARHRAPLEARLGRPVIEPTRAAVAMALGRIEPGAP